MDLLVIPNIENSYKKERARDEDGNYCCELCGNKAFESSAFDSHHMIALNAGGIDNDTLSRIFDIFYQTKISSSGLELPTCKAIVEEVLLGHMQISNIDNGSKIDIQISK